MDSVKDTLGKWGKMAADATKKAEDLAKCLRVLDLVAASHHQDFRVLPLLLDHLHLYICSGKRERCIIEKEKNFKEPGERYRSFTPERQERFIRRLIEALSDPRITHEIRSI